MSLISVPETSSKNMTFSANYSILRSELYPQHPYCEEHSKTIKLRNVNNQVVNFTERFETFISIGNLSRTEGGGKLNFKFLDARYENCGGLTPNLLTKCVDDDGKESIRTIAGLEIESGNITRLRCIAMGYLNSPTVRQTFPHRNWSKCFTSSGGGCDYPDEDDPSQRDKIIGASVGGSLLLLSMVGVMSGRLLHYHRSRTVKAGW